MLSSKISHTQAVHDILQPSSVACGKLDDADEVDDRNWLDEALDATPFHLGDVDAVLSVLDTGAEAAVGTVAGSTSTTRNTALPSRTLRTLSASQSPRDDKEDEEEREDPVKASQNALPNLRKTVWLAMAANMACSCSFWDDNTVEELEEVVDEDCEEWSRGRGSEAPPFGRSKGEVGGVGYADDDVDEGLK